MYYEVGKHIAKWLETREWAKLLLKPYLGMVIKAVRRLI